MIKKEQISALIESHFEETDKFLVRLVISKDNLINIHIDGDQGVTIDDCVKLSRHIEENLDREAEDFELRVSSSGAEEPFVNIRQYVKNIGRFVRIQLSDGEIVRGVLESANETSIVVKKEKKSKNKKSKKMETDESITIPMDSIDEARVVIIF